MMVGWLLLPILLACLFGAVAPGVARRLPPAVATWLLSIGSLVAAGTATAGVAVLGFLAVAEVPAATQHGQWAASVLRAADPYAVPIGASALVAIALLGGRAIRTGYGRGVALRDAFRLAAALPDTGTDLAVLDSTAIQAFAVPGRPGRIVATSALLQHLNSIERRALFAHERAHLRQRHHLHQTAGQLAAAAMPALAPIPAAIELACERWADELAAAATSRATVANAIERAATAPLRPALPDAVMHAGAADVLTRTTALRSPAGQAPGWRLAMLAGLTLLTAAAGAAALHHTEQLFEVAQQAYRQGRR